MQRIQYHSQVHPVLTYRPASFSFHVLFRKMKKISTINAHNYNSPHSSFKTPLKPRLSSQMVSNPLLVLALSSGSHPRHSLVSYSSLPSRLSSTPSKLLFSTRSSHHRRLPLSALQSRTSCSLFRLSPALPTVISFHFVWIHSTLASHTTTKWTVLQCRHHHLPVLPHTTFFPSMKFTTLQKSHLLTIGLSPTHQHSPLHIPGTSPSNLLFQTSHGALTSVTYGEPPLCRFRFGHNRLPHISVELVSLPHQTASFTILNNTLSL